MNKTVGEISNQSSFEGVNEGVSLIDFWAPWCGPCRMQMPIVESVAAKMAGRARVAKVNVDENVAVAQRFGVQSIPTLSILKDGREIRRFVGVQSEETLLSALEQAM